MAATENRENYSKKFNYEQQPGGSFEVKSGENDLESKTESMARRLQINLNWLEKQAVSILAFLVWDQWNKAENKK